MKLLKIAGGLVIAWPVSLTLVYGESNPPTTGELLERIKQLEEQVRILSRNQQSDHDAAAQNAKSDPTVMLGSRGLELRSADTNFTMRIHAHIQADGRFYPDHNSSADDTFLMRRVRPMIDGTLFRKLDYHLMLDFGSGLTADKSNVGFVQDAYFGARLWPEFQIQAGKFKEPVGLERLKSDVDYIFIERSYPAELVPNRDVGVQLQGMIGGNLLEYELGVFNGVSDGGSADVDTGDDDKDIAARVFAHPFLKTGIEPLPGLGIGIAATYGHHGGPLHGYVSPGQRTIFNYYSGTGTNAVTAADGNLARLVPQASYYYGPFGLLAEYAISATEVTRSGGGISAPAARLEHTGWQVAGSYFLTREQNGFERPEPLHPVSFRDGGWGAWEVVARVSQLKLDSKTFPLFADPASNASEAFSYGAGVNWHLNRNFKLSLDYEHTNFKGGKSNPVVAQDEDAILTRAQIAF